MLIFEIVILAIVYALATLAFCYLWKLVVK